LSDFVSSDDEEDQDDDEDTEQGKLRDNDEPGWVMGTISKMVQQHIERSPQKQMKLDELTQPGWGDKPDYFCDRDLEARHNRIEGSCSRQTIYGLRHSKSSTHNIWRAYGVS